MPLLRRRPPVHARAQFLPSLWTELASAQLSGVRSGSRGRLEVLCRMRQGGDLEREAGRLEEQVMKKTALVFLLAAIGCATASAGGGGGATPAPAPTQMWPVLTRLHIDLWLHGYAMLLR